MTKKLCTGSMARSRWAVSLCFASTVLTSLESVHPSDCSWMQLDPGQSWALNVTIATVTAFLGTFILTQMITQRGETK